MKENAQNYMDMLLLDLTESKHVPTLCLHSCCAPCSTYVIEYLSSYFSITVFYYNPNIFPEDEYRFRAQEQQRFIATFPTKHKVSFLEGVYEPQRFYRLSAGLEAQPEGGLRCEACIEHRLLETAKMADELGSEYFATTLTISPLKNVHMINTIGNRIGEHSNANYLPSEFRKRNGFLRSTQITQEYEMYRQDYCGCEYSVRQ